MSDSLDPGTPILAAGLYTCNGKCAHAWVADDAAPSGAGRTLRGYPTFPSLAHDCVGSGWTLHREAAAGWVAIRNRGAAV